MMVVNFKHYFEELYIFLDTLFILFILKLLYVLTVLDKNGTIQCPKFFQTSNIYSAII